MYNQQNPMPRKQAGVAMLAVTLTLLVAMTLLTAIGARVVINSQRVADNASHGEAAFHVADAALDNALAYLNFNRAYVSSTATDGWMNAGTAIKWETCNAADTTPPCGDGVQNLYPSQDPDATNVWMKYGPVPNLIPPVGAAPGNVNYTSEVYFLSENLADAPANAPDLGCLNLGLSALVPSSLWDVIEDINDLLEPLAIVGFGLPEDLCLPLNFSGSDVAPTPSSVNPTIRAVAYSSGDNSRAGEAVIQQDFQTVSRFVNGPLAPLVGNTTIHLYSTPASDNHDVRIWGNPRPPTVDPYDFSILQLNDIAGLNITNLIGSHLGTIGAPLEAATLAPLLNLTVAEVLALDWNVTFPLSIWSDQTVQLKASATMDTNLLKVGRTCAPPFAAGSTCVPLSMNVSLKNNAISSLYSFLGLPCLLFCSSSPISAQIKLPDIQDPENFANTLTGLLDSSDPVDFPDDLFEYIFGVAEADKDEVLLDGVLLEDCSDLHTRPSGFYRLDQDDCDINGVVGSSAEPMLLVVDRGDVSLASNSEFYGMIFMTGPDHRLLEGTTSTDTAVRPTIHGSVLSTAATHVGKQINLVYDGDVIRRSGFTAGMFTRLPGSWSDEVTGP